jgi:CheY-like chemotaxis protein
MFCLRRPINTAQLAVLESGFTFMSPLALVVDDSALIRHTVRHFLEKLRISVQCVCNGREALEVLQTLRPDVIFTDLQMPRLDGYMLIDALKARAEIADIPVLVLAARPLNHDQPEPRAHAIIYKDFNIEQQLTQALATIFPSKVS